MCVVIQSEELRQAGKEEEERAFPVKSFLSIFAPKLLVDSEGKKERFAHAEKGRKRSFLLGISAD